MEAAQSAVQRVQDAVGALDPSACRGLETDKRMETPPAVARRLL